MSSEEQKKLTAEFSSIAEVNSCSDEHNYKHLSISVFDHWLNLNEASALLDNVSTEEDKRRKNLHSSLNTQIIQTYDCLTYRMKGRHKKQHARFKRFTNHNAAMEYVIPSEQMLPSDAFFKLVIPEIHCVYIEGTDYTNHLYYLNEPDIKLIVSLAEKCGLFILD